MLAQFSAVVELAECVFHFQSPKLVKELARLLVPTLLDSFLAWFAARESGARQLADRTLSLNCSYLILASAAE